MADKKRGLELVSNALDGAQPAARVGRRRGAAQDNEEPELPLLPPDCPIQPLGVYGQLFFYLDERKQLISLDPQKHGKNHIIALFGRRHKLVHVYWPRYSDKTNDQGERIVTGWKPEQAAEILMGACAFAGIFDPQGKVRGSGAHRDDDGELVLHCGDKIFRTGAAGGYEDPGLIDGYVYPAGAARPRPDPLEQNAEAGELMLRDINAWKWARPLIDPMLLLGWIGCAMIGGALHWRPHAWVTGGSGTGKSTLQGLLRAVFEGGALTTGDATEASLRQLLKQQTLPVFFDELEAEEDNRRNQAVIKLARLASSGEQALRGGQDHQGHEFTIRSCFLFSSILLPKMQVQDRNRLAILELEANEPGKAAPSIDLAEIRARGRRLRRRMIDHWHRIDEVIERYKSALADVGHSGRSGDQFGTLLAIADLLLYDTCDQETVLEWADRLRAGELAEKATEIPDEQEAVQFLATSFMQQRGGEEPEPIVRHIRAALEVDGNKARERLENFGLRIVAKKVTVREDGTTSIGIKDSAVGVSSAELYLAIANSHVALGKLFQASHRAAGVWSQSFGRVAGAHKRVKVRFAGAPGQWATLIPLSAILELTPEKPD